jgi:hypothetical protein
MQVSIMADPPEKKEAQQLVLDLSTPTSTKIPEPSEVSASTTVVHLSERRTRGGLSAVRSVLAKTGVFRMEDV